MDESAQHAEAVRDIEAIFRRHADDIYRLCYSFLRSRDDAEDAVQDTFMKLMKSKISFLSHEHEKAWLIVTASNTCKDMLKHWWRKNEDIDEHADLADDSAAPDGEVLEAVMKLPPEYKATVFMYYYVGYSTSEIAAVMKKPPSTVRNQLSRARKQLKNMLGGEKE